MTKLIQPKDFDHILDSYHKINENVEQLLIINLIKKFGIHQRQQINEHINNNHVMTKSNEEKSWLDSEIVKFSSYPSFVRYEWFIENNQFMVIYACGGKIIKMFPSTFITSVSKL